MLHIKMLSAVTPYELQSVGYRGLDLSILASHQLPTAQSFVVTSSALDEMIRIGGLRYKMEYLLSHAQPLIQSSMQNAYTSIRKLFLETSFPPGLDIELRDTYERITTPLAIGELVTERPPVRIIASLNRLDDPENNDTVIQNITSVEELQLAVREAWSLAYHPSMLGTRLKEKFPEQRLKVALIVQVMEDTTTSCHAYSCLPQDHKKIYLQAYFGQLDLREKITKDYYAVTKKDLHVVASQVRAQAAALQRNANGELTPVPLSNGASEKLIDRDIFEIARLAKKSEGILKAPIKLFFSSKNDTQEILWVNRLGFDIILDSNEKGTAETTETTVEEKKNTIIEEEKHQIIEKQQPSTEPPLQTHHTGNSTITNTERAVETTADSLLFENAAEQHSTTSTTGNSAAELLEQSITEEIPPEAEQDMSTEPVSETPREHPLEVSKKFAMASLTAEPHNNTPAIIHAHETHVTVQHGQQHTTTQATITPGGIAATLLNASLRIVNQVVERKYRSTFGESPSAEETLANRINRLNSANVFSRNVDGALLLQAEEAARQEGHITAADYAKTIAEVAYLMTYA